MESFTPEELNALGVMVSNAPISGKDAAFVAALLEKIKRMMEQEDVQVS
jgi:hypothetical protein